MGATVTRQDFEWSYTAEPHATRRKEILAKYPQIKQLMVHDPSFKWVAAAMVLFQFISIPIVSNLSWPLVLLGAYCLGGVLNHSLMLAVHETSHGEAFGVQRVFANHLFGAFLALPMLVPMSSTFKKYHIEHHKFQGDEKRDTDIPSRVEAYLFNTTFRKFIWVVLQPFFYSLRPMLVYPKTPSMFEIVNIIVTLTFDFCVYYFFGWKPIVYLLGGGFMAMGLHPVAGHFISEHYMFKKGYETYSYYGPLNWLCFNVGYHNEHHDFPNVPGSKLPLVKKIAPEFYDDLPQHDSWVKVIYDFVTDPDVGPYARIKRKTAGYSD
ncbi:unnamed protein product [Cyprideis torosa]|uniref:sphingolipid 4-desaturase n=1 Tax=Cyprideis torosa TaxID=163714 RepID=A0A7R8ZG03_9CRUS|nr:unnamed protein product [Cyprideis torosa]CAG0880402.1 unnamed protein product [Cyprideis torosa]